MPETLLIVGDADYIRTPEKSGTLLPKHPDLELTCCTSDNVIRTISNQAFSPAAILLSLRPEEERKYLDIIASIHAVKPEPPIIVLVQYGAEALAQKAMQAGAYDYLFKPVPLERLRLSIQHAIATRRMRSYIRRLEERIGNKSIISTEERSAVMLNQIGNFLIDNEGQVKPLRELEKEIILSVLRYSNGCVARAARNLGIGRSTLYRKVGKLDKHSQMVPDAHTMRPMIDMSSKQRSSVE